MTSDDPPCPGIEQRFKTIQNELHEIDNTIRPTSELKLFDQLNFLVNEKLETATIQ